MHITEELLLQGGRGWKACPSFKTILGFYYINLKQLPVRSAQYYNHNLEIGSIRSVIARCAMFPAGISIPALTNLTQGWEFRYGGNNRRDTVLRSCWKTMYWLLRICSLKSITDNRKLGSGDVRFEGEVRQTVYVLPSTGSAATSQKSSLRTSGSTSKRELNVLTNLYLRRHLVHLTQLEKTLQQTQQ